MRLLRVFMKNATFTEWQNAQPDLGKLLQCFDVTRTMSKPPPASVFRVLSELEELESVAAVFQKSRSSPEKLFGVVLTESDCRSAGMAIEPEQGQTGVRHVDACHFNLVGDSSQFRELVAGVVRRIWEGEQRIRVFPAKQITGQVAVLSKLHSAYICDESRECCEAVLSKASCHEFDHANLRVQIIGSLFDKPPFEVRATRSYDPSAAAASAAPPAPSWRGIVKKLLSAWTKRWTSRKRWS